MDTTKLLHAACPTINDVGWAYYFAPSTIARGERLGLDQFTFYFLGRGGVLGDVEADVVASAFGYFNPSLLKLMWDQGRATLAPRDAGREFFAAAHDFGRERLAGLDLAAFNAAAETVVTEGRARAGALVLFAAAAAEPLPDDAPARAAHLLAVLREYRGSVHLVAVAAEGLDPRVAHYLRRPDMFAMFGWSDADVPEVTQEDTDALARAEERTDRLCAAAYGALDDDGAVALLSGLDVIAPRLRGEA